jgi:hypothetical protein
MSTGTRKRIIRLLGVCFDGDDGHVRITEGKDFDILMGSDESHEYMNLLINKIEEELARRGLHLDQLNPDQLGDLVREIV